MQHQFSLEEDAVVSSEVGQQSTEETVEIKFLGIVKSFDEQKRFGMIECNESGLMWQQDIYIYKDVLQSAGAGVGETVRFGIHVSPKGQPQASLPVYKVGDDNQIVGEIKGKDQARMPYWQFVEDMGLTTPDDYERVKQLVEQRSAKQNAKTGSNPRAQKRSATSAWGVEVSLYVSGVPSDVSRREIAHIFRQYSGFLSLRTVPKDDHTLTFVSFSSHEEAEYAAMSLNGYVFDEEAEQPTPLVLHVARGKNQGKGKDAKGQSKGAAMWASGGVGGYGGGSGWMDNSSAKGGGWTDNGYGKGGGGSGMLQHGATIGVAGKAGPRAMQNMAGAREISL